MRGGLTPCLVVVATLLAACATYYVPRESGRSAGVAAIARGNSELALARLIADMDAAMLALARRHDPGLNLGDDWGRALGWASLDIRSTPTLGAPVLTADDARRVNTLKPFNFDAIRPAAPFVLTAQGAERDRALRCLTQAVYFEAATEPLEGRRAVAQTVLNRLRHPGYPKSVCGVVFEGAARATGCQFSFTCDGSLGQAPILSLWAQAEDVARQALAGYVVRDVGTATHYHADYVLPYWAPTLLKLTQIGAHIFYRWTGPAGEPGAFNGRYAGGESNVSADILNGVDERIQGAGLGAPSPPVAAQPERMAGVEGMVSVVAVPDPTAPGGQRLQLSGAIGGRRIPTPEEVAKINALIDARIAGAAAGGSETAAPPAPSTLPPAP